MASARGNAGVARDQADPLACISGRPDYLGLAHSRAEIVSDGGMQRGAGLLEILQRTMVRCGRADQPTSQTEKWAADLR
jgi:hypothetical protein